MAIGGGDENTRINITAVPKGFEQTAAQLDAFIKKLQSIQSSMRAIGNVQGLRDVSSALSTASSAAGQLSNHLNNSSRFQAVAVARMKQLANETRQATAAQDEYNKRYLYGVKANANTKAGQTKIAGFQQSMAPFNMALIGKPENLVGLVNNLKAAHSGLKDVRTAGIATRDVINAINSPGSAQAFGIPLSKTQQFSAMLQIARKNVTNLFDTWGSKVTNMQWAGRQMLQGITFPLTALAVSAVNSWASIEKEILSIKKVTDFKGIGDDVDYSGVRKEIRSLSTEYAVSEKGAANAYQEIIQLGVRGAENVAEYTKNVLDLSLLGNMDTASAFEFFRTLKALETDQPGRSMMDSIKLARVEMAKMNAISDNTSVKLQDLAAAFPEVAPVMQQMGFSASAIGASLAGMYKRGIPATEAAHGLKFALQRLVTPTRDSKAIIDQLGFSFFNAEGHMSDASAKMFELAEQFGMMTEQERAIAAPELFGSRQAARMNSYFNDIKAGGKELKQLAAGQIKWEDLTSDFLKGLIATQEIKLPGVDVSEVEDAVLRYDAAIELFKKDPLKAFERLKVTFKQIYTQLGATIAPAIISVGEKFVAFLQGLQNAPPLLQKIAMAIAAIAVAIGPLKYITAQLAATGISLGRTAMALTTKKMVDVMPSQVGSALAARSSGNFMYLGEKTMMNPKAGFVDRMKGKFGFFDSVSGGSRGGLGQAAIAAQRTENLAAIKAEIELNKQLIASKTLEGNATVQLTLQERALELQRLKQVAAAEAEIAAEAARITSTETATAANSKRGVMGTLGLVGKKTAEVGKKGAANMASIFTTGATTGGTSILTLLTQGATKAGIWGIAIAAIIAVVVLLVVVFKNAKNAWASFVSGVKPGIDAIKRGFESIKAAFSKVAEKFSSVLGQLGDSTGAEGTADFFSGLGQIIGFVADKIGVAMGWIANAIVFVMPFFEQIAYMIKNVIGFIGALFKGEWKQALLFFVAAVYEIVRPIVVVWDIILKTAAQFVASLLDVFSTVTDWVPWLGDAIGGARDALEAFSDSNGITGFLDDKLRSNLGDIFSGGVTDGAKKAEPDANKAGQGLGEQVGEGIGLGVEDSAGGSGTSWVKSWIDKVIGRIDKELDKVRRSATEALKKAHDAALKVYDDRVKAIEDQEKAEEKLYRTEEYLAKKRELLANRNLDKQNYLTERAAAVYEGRYSDVRMLDLQEQADKQKYSDDLSSIESDRAKDLLKESRDLAKEQINIEKDTAQKRLEIQAKLFEDWMAAITEFTPLTVGEFQSMTDQINALLINAGATWPEYATSAMDRFGYIFQKANEDIVDEFRKSGNSAVTAWMESFIGSEQLKILQAMAASGGGGGGGVVGGGGAKPGVEAITPEVGAFLASLENPAANATPEQIAAFVGTGQGLGGPAEKGSTRDYKPPAKYGTIGGVDMDSIDAATQAMIDLIKHQVAMGDMTNQNSEYFSIAMLQLQQDAANAYGGTATIVEQSAQRAADALAAANEKALQGHNGTTSASAEAYHKMFAKIITGTSKFENDYNTIFGRTVSEIKVYTDSTGEMWEEVNGKMTNRFGETAKRIIDEHGRVTDNLISDNGRIIQGTTETYKNTEQEAIKLFDQMIKLGIQPGTAEAAKYVEKINALGIAVSNIDGKTVMVKIDMNSELFWRNAELVTSYVKSFEGQSAVAAFVNPGAEVFEFAGARYIKYPDGRVAMLASGGMYSAMSNTIKKFAGGGLVKNQKDGILANIGEGGFDEFIITTDPKYRASNMAYLAAAASKLGVKMASGAAIKAASSGASISYATANSSEYGGKAGGNGGDVYISVDTFIGEEQWFAELASKYNMKTVPRQRKIEGQQKRVVSSYNNRWNLR